MKIKILTAVAAVLILHSQSQILFAASSEQAKENLKQLSQTKSCRNCDLRELNFDRMDLSHADLEGADLSQSRFFLTNLSSANLKNAILVGAQFGGADLGEADLTGADLRGVSLDTAYTAGAKMSGQIISTKPFEKIGVKDVKENVYVESQAVPKKAPSYQKAEVVKPKRIVPAKKKTTRTETPKSVVTAPAKKIAVPPAATVRPEAPPAKKSAGFGSVVMASVEKPKASVPTKDSADTGDNTVVAPVAMEEAQVKKAVMPETPPAIDQVKLDNWALLLDKKRCYGCNLAGLDLSHENLKGADLEKADLSGCNLEKANLRRANLKGAQLVGANLKGANLKNADLYKANLTDADLTGAEQTDISLDGAVMKGAVGLENGLMMLGN